MEVSLRQKLIDIKKRMREIEVTVDVMDIFRSTYLKPVNSTSPGRACLIYKGAEKSVCALGLIYI